MSEGELSMPTKVWMYVTYSRCLAEALKLVMQLPFLRNLESHLASPLMPLLQCSAYG